MQYFSPTTSSVTPPMCDILVHLHRGVPPVSLRLGHGSALKLHRSFIHYLTATSLPTGEGLYLHKRYYFSREHQGTPLPLAVKFVQTKPPHWGRGTALAVEGAFICTNDNVFLWDVVGAVPYRL